MSTEIETDNPVLRLMLNRLRNLNSTSSPTIDKIETTQGTLEISEEIAKDKKDEILACFDEIIEIDLIGQPAEFIQEYLKNIKKLQELLTQNAQCFPLIMSWFFNTITEKRKSEVNQDTPLQEYYQAAFQFIRGISRYNSFKTIALLCDCYSLVPTDAKPEFIKTLAAIFFYTNKTYSSSSIENINKNLEALFTQVENKNELTT